MVLGLYYLTKERRSENGTKVQGEGKTFYSSEEVVIAHNEGKLDLHALIKVRTRVLDENGNIVNKLIDTTTGKVLFNEVVPESVPYINILLTKKNLRKVIGDILTRTNFPRTAQFLDDIKDLGFSWAFRAGSVSYTHLDVYKRQEISSSVRLHQRERQILHRKKNSSGRFLVIRQVMSKTHHLLRLHLQMVS